MYSRQTPSQKANIERLNAESAARMAKVKEEEAQAQAEQEAQAQAEQAFLERVKATNARLVRGESVADQVTTPTGLYAAKRAEEVKAEEAAAAARRAALTPLDIWKSTLPYQEQKRIAAWEQVNGMEWPIELTR